MTRATAPAVSLDLRPMDAEWADNRAIVAAEPPFYSLHLWRGGTQPETRLKDRARGPTMRKNERRCRPPARL